MKRNETTSTISYRTGFVLLLLFSGVVAQAVKGQANNRFFCFTPISESEFQTAFKSNHNAPFVTEIDDSLKQEAFNAIAKTYNEWEKELAGYELVTPRELTSFEAFYPDLDLCLFKILDLHYEKACFVFASTNKMASGDRRFYGSYGVMSKDGLWAGLARGDCDNYIQLEICKSWEDWVIPLFKFDFTGIDIDKPDCGQNIPELFWADKNTLYVSASDYEMNGVRRNQYYSIKFGY